MVIGYGKDNGRAYWLVQAARGNGWGDNGIGKVYANRKTVGRYVGSCDLTRLKD